MDTDQKDIAANNPTEDQPEIFAVQQDEDGPHFSRREFIEMAGVAATGVALVASIGATGLGSAESSGLLQRTATPSRTPTNCFVSTTRKDVRVHVGPGRNRGVRVFLPKDEEIEVIGQALDNEGEVWWQVSLTNIEQAWVADEDVTTIGDCAQVVTVATPPVRTPSSPRNTATPKANSPTTVPGVPGSVQPGNTGINYTVGGTTYTLPCGSAIPAGAVCVCNCVTVPAAPVCTCQGYCVDTHYWYPN